MLEIKGLRVSYGGIEIVRGVDLDIEKGECVGLVGESGCGKTTMGLAITRLIPHYTGAITGGRILFEGRDVLEMREDELRSLRRLKVSYVFQEPFTSLNPVFTIYEQIREALPEGADPIREIPRLLELVGMDEIRHRKKVYPHELSGGMQQRVMIAMAMASRPDLLILDEPTTALDVTVQKQILDLIRHLGEDTGLSILFISHDLRVVLSMARRIFVMYAGVIVESGPAADLVKTPLHPYTLGLINSIPSIRQRKERFDAIEGRAPLFSELPHGCKFYPRCRFRTDLCKLSEPRPFNRGKERVCRCIIKEGLKNHGVIKGI